MERDEIQRLLDHIFHDMLGTPARTADVELCCQMIADQPDTPPSEIIGDYVWDHWMGEPDEPTRSRVIADVFQLRQDLDRAAGQHDQHEQTIGQIVQEILDHGRDGSLIAMSIPEPSSAPDKRPEETIVDAVWDDGVIVRIRIERIVE